MTYGSSVAPVTSINKTDRHDITEILLKVALNTIKQTKPVDMYFIDCDSYQDFLDKVLLIVMKLLNQEFLVVKLSHLFISFTVAIVTFTG